MIVRSYTPLDYVHVVALYKQPELYGGNFDEARDAEEKLRKRVEADPDAILVAQDNGKIVGTVSLIEDGRVAWLFRFCVQKLPNELAIAQTLLDNAVASLKAKGHTQVLVYTPTDKLELHKRYEDLEFRKGGDYTCFWKNI